MSNFVELLAPAGNLEVLKAVINAGADAVYLGGNQFGARAYAGNFNNEELLEAIDYAHTRGAKVYLTVNTLVKERELDSLYSYLEAPYKEGLDACLVQDLGAFRFIRENFKGLGLHASTQAYVTGAHAAQLFKDMGAERVVLAREMSLAEIKKINDSVDVDTECFVHGALCYCYSGQCLLSSMIGQRSGNRGRCAQACRLAYNHEFYNSELRAKGNGREANGPYALSPKDMSTIEILPQIIEAGVNSLKIEGRMKGVAYGAGLTEIYRKYLDKALSQDKADYRVAECDKIILSDLFNRGGFTKGYYIFDKGPQMMSTQRPDNQGTPAIRIDSNKDGYVTFKTLTEIHAHDVFEIDKEHSFTSAKAYKKGESFGVNLPKKYWLKPGAILSRIKNTEFVDHVEETYLKTNKEHRRKIAFTLKAKIGLNMELASYDFIDGNYGQKLASLEANIIEEAKSSLLDKEKLREKLSKTSDTDFEIAHIEFDLDTNAFIPASALNELRRQVIEKTADAVIDLGRREILGQALSPAELIEKAELRPDEADMSKALKSAFIDQASELESFIKEGKAELYDRIYLDYKFLLAENKGKALKTNFESYDFYNNKSNMLEIIEDFKKKGLVPVLALPYVSRTKDESFLLKLLETGSQLGFETLLVRNLEQIGLLSKNKFSYKEIITDTGLYSTNSLAMLEIRDIVHKAGFRLVSQTLPYEWTANELASYKKPLNCELVAHAYVPLMISEQCVRKTYGHCDKSCNRLDMTNKRGDSYRILSECPLCYTLMFGKEPVDIRDNDELLEKIPYTCLRDQLYAEKSAYEGHYRLGVE